MSQLKKLERDVKYTQDTFNKRFIEADNMSKEEPKNIDLNISNKIEIEPVTYTEDLGIDMKNLFFKILETLANNNNPIPYIMNDSRRQYVFAIMIICIGGLLMFFSNLMIDK